MTVPSETPDIDPLIEEGLQWIARLKSGVATRDDLDELAAWRAQSEAHDKAFKTAARIFRRAGVAAGNLADRPAVAYRARPVWSRRAVMGGTIAAGTAAAAYLAAQPPFGLWPSLQELSADVRTATGEQRKLQLSPDVALQLNTQTSIAMRSSDAQPRIELISGEVAATADGSVEVLARGGEVRATRARFDVDARDGAVCVSCIDGAVDVKYAGRSTRIGAAEQLTYSASLVSPPVTFDPESLTAWQSGLLIFRNQTLTSVVDQINRYRPGKIIVASADLRRRLVNGRFQIGKLDDFIAQVEQLFDAKAMSLPGGLVILT